LVGGCGGGRSPVAWEFKDKSISPLFEVFAAGLIPVKRDKNSQARRGKFCSGEFASPYSPDQSGTVPTESGRVPMLEVL
jgi:hypothetical protein